MIDILVPEDMGCRFYRASRRLAGSAINPGSSGIEPTRVTKNITRLGKKLRHGKPDSTVTERDPERRSWPGTKMPRSAPFPEERTRPV
jgi:hypothetical protein